ADPECARTCPALADARGYRGLAAGARRGVVGHQSSRSRDARPGSGGDHHGAVGGDRRLRGPMHSRNSSRTSYVFRAAAALTLAHQVAGKAVRDGLFLAQFPATDLPMAVIAAAVLSVLLGLAFTRSLPRYGPMRLVPRALAAGALLHVAEFLMLRFGGAAARGPVIVLVYLHLAGFGAILLSGFWSVAGEAFDPREAKREFGRIAGVGTA